MTKRNEHRTFETWHMPKYALAFYGKPVEMRRFRIDNSWHWFFVGSRNAMSFPAATAVEARDLATAYAARMEPRQDKRRRRGGKYV